MTSTQNGPVMDGANDASEQEKQDGREDQIVADAARDEAEDDAS